MSLSAEQIELFTDAMVKKGAFGYGFVDGRFHWKPGDEKESFREFVRNVVVDTEMLLEGSVPMEAWLAP